VYARSLLVVALCTVFVLAFAFVLQYEASEVGQSGNTVPTSSTTCSPSDPSCDVLTIVSASIRNSSGIDLIGPGGNANLSLALDISGGSPLSSVKVFIGDQLGASINGPFQPGVVSMPALALSTQVSISPGQSYLITIEGYYGGTRTAVTSITVPAT
jgi:hypothetical protein